MHLTSADKRAVQDGFKFLVVAGGQRKCYCTTVKEAKREAGKGGKIVVLGKMRYTTQNPAKGTVNVASADKKGKPITDESFYFEKAGPFARTRSIAKGETPQTVKDDYDANAITHLPTGMIIYKGGFSLYDNQKKNAVQAMKDLRQWLKKLSAVEVQEISEGFTFGSRDLTPTQDKLLREAYAVCRSGKIERNPSHGATNRAFLSKLDAASRNAILSNIAKHYGITTTQALAEVTDPEAESLLDYVTGPQRAATSVLMQRHKFKNPSKKAKLASLDREIARREEMGLPVAHLLEQRDLLKKRNPTWTTTAILAAAAYIYGRFEPVREGVHAAARGAYKSAKEAIERRKAKENPGLTPAGKRHLIQTMHKAGADTFTKKMRYVRKHMPHITDPAAFVGYVMQGEKR